MSSSTRRNPEILLIDPLVVNEGPGTTRVTLSTFELVVCCEPVKILLHGQINRVAVDTWASGN